MTSPIPFPFQVIDWNSIPTTEHPGKKGKAYWQTVQLGGMRLRIVRYSPGYFADHWCRKGHIVHCLDGEFTSEMESGAKFHLSAGTTYIVSDEESSHRSISPNGVILLIIDGDFLQQREE